MRELLEANVVAAECTPPLDIVETDAGIEIVMDVPGVRSSEIDVVFARNVLVIAGQKLPGPFEHHNAAFHIAERAFGRFGRAIRVDGAYDATRGTASLIQGELRVLLPRQEERRGRRIRIPVT